MTTEIPTAPAIPPRHRSAGNRQPDLPCDVLDTAMGRIATDPAAFAVIYRHTYWRVHGAVWRVLRNAAYADEVTQEVFFELWRHADRFHPGRDSTLGWLLTLAHGRAVDRVRAEQAAQLRDATAGFRAVADGGEDPETLVVERTEYDHLKGLLDALTPDEHKLLVLALLGPQSQRQLAEALGIPEGTLKTRLRRLRNQLRGRAAEDGRAAPIWAPENSAIDE